MHALLEDGFNCCKRGFMARRPLDICNIVTIQQGVPRGLQGPLAGCGVPPPFSLTPPPEAAQEKGDLNSYTYFANWGPVSTPVLCRREDKGISSSYYVL